MVGTLNNRKSKLWPLFILYGSFYYLDIHIVNNFEDNRNGNK